MKRIFSRNVLSLIALLATGCLLAGCRSSYRAVEFRATPLPATMPSDQVKSGFAKSVLAPKEEVWVIASNDAHVENRERPAAGTLLAIADDTQAVVPLVSTDVHARVAAYIASVEMAQRFQNPYSSNINAIYLFPLPSNGAVNDFQMTIGERRIRGIIRERAEAEKIYAAAKQQGFTASLLIEQQHGLFSQSVANIEPGKAIEVKITYFHTLILNNGWWEFVFPAAIDKQARPDFSLALGIDAGLPIQGYECNTHHITSSSPNPHQLEVSLVPSNQIANGDFVFRYRVANAPVDAIAVGANKTNVALSAVWARSKMVDLLERTDGALEDARIEEIRRLAMDYNLLSPVTAFLAVDSTKDNPAPNPKNER